MVTSGGMTKLLDRLETRGLLQREPDPRDRRGKLIALTDDGRALVDEVVAAHVANEQRLLADLSRGERERLASLLRSLLLSLEGPR
jgi:DNA-binding MarR family transcriptional regulator